MSRLTTMGRITAIAAAVAIAGCSTYVKRDELTVLHENDRRMAADIQALQDQMSQLTRDLEIRFQDYDAKIADLGGRVRVDMTAHFGFDEATLRQEDMPALDDFAAVLREGYPDVVVTVEGFTDPAGSATYNERLGQARAEAVRDYLVSSGGLSADRVRAVSYGEASERQVLPGAAGPGPEGMANRRVALVVDYAGEAELAGR